MDESVGIGHKTEHLGCMLAIHPPMTMRSLLFVALFSLAPAWKSWAGELACEGFEYSSGPLDSSLATGGRGWALGWTKDQISVAQDGKSLDYPRGVKAVTTGSRIEHSGAVLAQRLLAPEVAAPLNSDGGILYISVLVKKNDEAKEADSLTFSLIPSPAETRFILEFGITSTEKFRVALFGENGKIGASYANNSTCLLVVKLERAQGRLSAKLWTFDADTEVPAAEPEPTLETEAEVPAEWQRVLFRVEQSANANGQADEIRLVDDWRGVVGE